MRSYYHVPAIAHIFPAQFMKPTPMQNRQRNPLFATKTTQHPNNYYIQTCKPI